MFKVSDDEDDEDAYLQRHNLEILKASVDAREKQMHYKTLKQEKGGESPNLMYDENTTGNDEMLHNEVDRRSNIRRKKRLLSAEEEALIGNYKNF